jgi:hypothetical protein
VVKVGLGSQGGNVQIPKYPDQQSCRLVRTFDAIAGDRGSVANSM